MRFLMRGALAALFLTLALATAEASRNVAPCPSVRWCRDVATLGDAVYVYAPYGTFHLRNGHYAKDGVTVAFFDRPGLIAFDGAKAAVVTLFAANTGQTAVYVHIFRRIPSGLYENAATRKLGAVRPMNVTLHGNRLRVSALDARGHQSTTIYHLSGHALHAVAIRHAQ
jgi:hypothetical protein